jgi:hypothetical protein
MRSSNDLTALRYTFVAPHDIRNLNSSEWLDGNGRAMIVVATPGSSYSVRT